MTYSLETNNELMENLSKKFGFKENAQEVVDAVVEFEAEMKSEEVIQEEE